MQRGQTPQIPQHNTLISLQHPPWFPSPLSPSPLYCHTITRWTLLTSLAFLYGQETPLSACGRATYFDSPLVFDESVFWFCSFNTAFGLATVPSKRFDARTPNLLCSLVTFTPCIDFYALLPLMRLCLGVEKRTDDGLYALACSVKYWATSIAEARMLCKRLRMDTLTTGLDRNRNSLYTILYATCLLCFISIPNSVHDGPGRGSLRRELKRRGGRGRGDVGTTDGAGCADPLTPGPRLARPARSSSNYMNCREWQLSFHASLYKTNCSDT